MPKAKNTAVVQKALNEIEDTILECYNADCTMSYSQVMRCRDLIRQIEKELIADDESGVNPDHNA